MTALSSNFDADMAQLQAHNEMTLHNMSQEIASGTMMTNAMLPMLPPTDPFATYDMGMHQYWTDTNLDLFNDLVGVESGLTSLMAG